MEMSYERAVPREVNEFSEYLDELFDICIRGFFLRNEILASLAEPVRIEISDKNIVGDLNRIRADKDPYVIRQYKSLAKLANVNAGSDHEKIPISIGDFVHDQFDENLGRYMSEFDVSDYYSKKIQIGCLVVGYQGDKSIDTYYSEIREAYAHGLHRACISLCRALIEIVLHEILNRKGLLGSTGAVNIKTGRDDRNNLPCLINKAKRADLISFDEKELAFEIKKTAEKILHRKDRTKQEEPGPTQSETYTAIKNTIIVVESALQR